jgi:sulfur carrier protein
MSLQQEQTLIANGQTISATLPCTIDDFLLQRGFPPRSVVVEHNGDAVAPSEFKKRNLQAGDRLEIVQIVAGG